MDMDTLIIAGLVVLIFTGIAVMRKGSSAVKTKPGQLMSFTTLMTASDVVKTVVRFAQQTGYEIDDIADSGERIILSDSTTLTSVGYFYPVYVSKQNDGNTLVEVGIKSKVLQVGPIASTIASRRLERCFNGIKAAITANTLGSIA